MLEDSACYGRLYCAGGLVYCGLNLSFSLSMDFLVL